MKVKKKKVASKGTKKAASRGQKHKAPTITSFFKAATSNDASPTSSSGASVLVPICWLSGCARPPTAAEPSSSSAIHSGYPAVPSSASLIRAAALAAKIHCCTYPGCGKTYASPNGLSKHVRQHKIAAAQKNALDSSAYKQVDRYAPVERLRDWRLIDAKRGCAGVKRALAQGIDDAKTRGRGRKKVKQLIAEGSTAFGSMDDWIFGAAVRKRLETELPLSLQDFEMPESQRYVGKGSTSYSALMAYLTGCFVAYEAEIARLNAVIRDLKSENAHLKVGEAPDKAASQLSGGSSPTTVGEWSSRTLRMKSAAFTDAVLKESGGCDLKAITLAREILRKLDAEEDGYQRDTTVNSAIVLALKNFYVQVGTAPSPSPSLHFSFENVAIVVKTLYQPNSTFRGARGELIKEDEWFMQVRKYEESVASTNYYVPVEEEDVGCDGGDGGLLYIPAENVVVMDVKVVNKRMPKDVAIKAMGEEWGDLSRKESREILSSECSYLPKVEGRARKDMAELPSIGALL